MFRDVNDATPCAAKAKSARQRHRDDLLKAKARSEVENILCQNELRHLIPIMSAFDIEESWQLQVAMRDGELHHLCPEDQEALWAAFDKRSHPVYDKTMRVVADWPLGNIAFPRWIWSQIVDTPPFQRLRGLKQLGNSHYVFPEATHTRYRHSLGVGHLARDWCSKLGAKLNVQGHTHWQEAIRDAVTIAGLCHDLGHGPMSHAFERTMNETLASSSGEEKWSHEQMSLKIFDYICDSYQLGETMDDLGVRIMVKDIIQGNTQRPADIGLDDPVAALEAAAYQIVANRYSGCDVDRFEYLARDCLVARGLPKFNSERLRTFSRIVDYRIVFSFREFSEIFTFYHSRYEMFTKVYRHPKSQGIDHMYADILKLSDKIFGFTESVNDVEKFMQLTDACLDDWLTACRHLKSGHLASILGEDEGEFIKAEAILNRLKRREVYKFAGEVQLLPGFDKNRLKDNEKLIDEIYTCSTSNHLRREDIIVAPTRHDYGAPVWNQSSNCSPWDAVLFYKPGNEEIVKLPETLRANFPSEWSRDILRFFSRDGGNVDALEAAVIRWATEQGGNAIGETPSFPLFKDDTALCMSPQALSPASSYWVTASGPNAGTPTRILRYNQIFSSRTI